MGFSNLMKAALLSSLTFSNAQTIAPPRANSSTAILAPLPFPSDLCGINGYPTGLEGKVSTPQLPDGELTAMLRQVSPERIGAIIEKLVSFGTRHTQSTQTDPARGIGAARDWLLKEFQSYAAASDGWMTVELQSYIQPAGGRLTADTNVSNIIATLKGTTDPGRIIVLSGHYDSRKTDVMDFTGDAPGADDDASGVAISLELARIMATHRPAATIQFAAVAGEEQNLYGSGYMARQLAAKNANVQGMWTNDIVGSPIGDDGKNNSNIIRLFAQGTPVNETSARASRRLTIGGESDSPARQLGRFTRDVASNVLTGMSVETIYRTDRYLRGGDHSSFLAQGYAANRFTEPRENFAHQHQDVRVENGTQYGDLPEFCDYYYISRVAKVNGAAAWSLANGPENPQNVTIDTTILTNDSILSWARAKGAVAYEIMWRPTDEPFWTHYIEVGDVTGARVPISKDNVVFGVRSVAKNGYRSPAVFPFPG
ncbi:Zn-dependent exopeptidase [Glarea lozoyensis ATCC 20868]|uniref:Peptide hydrolase n=1 Tax=Glarea lozoyensis (strain ATCC 20868 / MF5171) TaxID=1116229 RepID=S3CT09_GLAL2|nr:Zn-dependent exopeptidase [Glarea lozoyensis ATCC 20868]EPE29567.1 Zn-dependent exopeptidase [Glarea lozoyensis ATCC 20868]